MDVQKNIGEKGILSLCATPIGNLEDITLRVIRTLEETDYVVAEDTRRTLKLLNHLGISKPLLSYHKFSDEEREERIISLLETGHNIALVSDAGMPGISDPGERLVRLAHDRNIPVTLLPGATAGLSALVLSGLPSGRFVFEGFLPANKKARREVLEELRDEERTVILYEAPHRLLKTLNQLYEVLGNREIAVVRELTKIHEEVLSFSLKEGIKYFNSTLPKGEFVLIIKGKEKAQGSETVDEASIAPLILEYMEMGLSKKEAIKRVAADFDIARNRIYKFGINIAIGDKNNKKRR
ncbi:MAG: 16S rRNA (cytidine(1402)-2'-O)-methyltransferase [Clostridiales bacterium]|nr:16S rRNA (cytidine(1402)-2'-O)-methyltransferase [Clostridiales bacterium]